MACEQQLSTAAAAAGSDGPLSWYFRKLGYKALQDHELTDDLLNIPSEENPELRQGLNF